MIGSLNFTAANIRLGATPNPINRKLLSKTMSDLAFERKQNVKCNNCSLMSIKFNYISS